MTKTLQILFILILGIILIFWVGDLFLGTPAKVSDRAISEGWAEDSDRYKTELIISRLRSLLYAIPTIFLLVLTIKSYRRRKHKLFFVVFLIGLTLFQIVPAFGLYKVTDGDSTFFRPLLVVLFILFLTGQIISIYKLRRLKHSNHVDE